MHLSLPPALQRAAASFLCADLATRLSGSSVSERILEGGTDRGTAFLSVMPHPRGDSPSLGGVGFPAGASVENVAPESLGHGTVLFMTVSRIIEIFEFNA